MFHYPETTEFAPNKTSLRLMKQIHGYFRATQKTWAHISQAWLMEQMLKFEKQTVPSSTLNYNLRILEDQGFIQRQKRHKRDKVSGQIIFRPSMYRITKKLRMYFSKMANYYARCGWTPTTRQMGNGFTAVVGPITTREAAHQEYRKRMIENAKQATKARSSG